MANSRIVSSKYQKAPQAWSATERKQGKCVASVLTPYNSRNFVRWKIPHSSAKGVLATLMVSEYKNS